MSISTLARRPLRGDAPNVAMAPGAPGGGGGTGKDAFDALTRYIPTETITIFVAAMGAHVALKTVFNIEPWTLYGICAVLTPVILWLVAYGRHHQANDGTAFKFAIWAPTAATIAFLVWALSVPGLLTATGDVLSAEQTLAAVGAVLISALLSLLEPIFTSPPQA